MFVPKFALWPVLVFASGLPAFGGEITPSGGPIAVVSGFEVMEKDVPGIRSATSLYNLTDVIRKIARSIGQLEKFGVDATPAGVRRWRDAKLAHHKERARILREVMAHPDRAKSIYEATSSSAIVYGSWLGWTLGYRTEERIAAWENQPTVGHFRFDLIRGTQPALWMLLESMVQERSREVQPRVPAYVDVLSKSDVETLRSLGRSASEDASDIFVYTPGFAVSVEMQAMLDSMRNSVFLGDFERDLMKIIERESIQNAKVEILRPELLKAKEYLSQLGPGELTRAQLLASMTVPEAIEALSVYNGRMTLAMLTLAKSKSSAIPLLLERLKVKETRGLGQVLVLLKWMEARESLAIVRGLRLWKSGDEGTLNGALALIAKLAPASLETVVVEAVTELETNPVYAGISKSFATPEVRRGTFYLAKYQPTRAKQVLRKYLSSPNPGVRLAAGRALADIGDAAGAKYALEFMEQADSESDRMRALDIIIRIGGQKEARALDELALRLKAPELAVSARDMEFAALAAEGRWPYVKKHLGNENMKVAYWAFAKVEAGFHRDDPEVGSILEYAAGLEGSVWQRRAKELHALLARKRARDKPRP